MGCSFSQLYPFLRLANIYLSFFFLVCLTGWLASKSNNCLCLWGICCFLSCMYLLMIWFCFVFVLFTNDE
ncbi:hypothetical protein V8F20_005933 [Naviculisporaceae sp. PSN 640]